jgi:ABC-type enterochelin transport system substrate-binding protein
MPKALYDDYKKEIEENIMVLARICGNEDETRLALDDVQKSHTSIAVIYHPISLTVLTVLIVSDSLGTPVSSTTK